MTAAADAATERDVALDLLMIIEHADDGYRTQFVGSEETMIEKVEYTGYVGGEKNHLVLTLDNGQRFDIAVEELSA